MNVQQIYFSISLMKRINLNLNLTSVIVIIAAGVLLPVMLSTAVGIVAICLAEDTGSIVTGVLIISFAVTASGCGLLALVFTGKKARLARRQADFIANVSHELRTPLSAIRLYAQTLQSGKLSDDSEKTLQCVDTILRSATWLDVMVDGILTWRASSKDIKALNMETQPVADSVSGAIDRFKSMIPPDEFTLTSVIETQLCVEHDANALSTVVLNLLTNAYKYTGSQKQITVSVQDRSKYVTIEVRDNGIGLTASEINRIFQPFYRATQRGRGEASGVGLGLAIAHHLIRQHKGTITVSSQKDEGSCFTINLPVKESNL